MAPLLIAFVCVVAVVVLGVFLKLCLVNQCEDTSESNRRRRNYYNYDDDYNRTNVYTTDNEYVLGDTVDVIHHTTNEFDVEIPAGVEYTASQDTDIGTGVASDIASTFTDMFSSSGGGGDYSGGGGGGDYSGGGVDYSGGGGGDYGGGGDSSTYD